MTHPIIEGFAIGLAVQVALHRVWSWRTRRRAQLQAQRLMLAVPVKPRCPGLFGKPCTLARGHREPCWDGSTDPNLLRRV